MVSPDALAAAGLPVADRVSVRDRPRPRPAAAGRDTNRKRKAGGLSDEAIEPTKATYGPDTAASYLDADNWRGRSGPSHVPRHSLISFPRSFQITRWNLDHVIIGSFIDAGFFCVLGEDGEGLDGGSH